MTGYQSKKAAAQDKLAQPEQEQKCWCTTCRPITMSDMRFVVCPDCGNKRCPKANDHCNACTGSNEVGQKGSSWEHIKPLAQPAQEPPKYSFKAYWTEDGRIGVVACIERPDGGVHLMEAIIDPPQETALEKI